MCFVGFHNQKLELQVREGNEIMGGKVVCMYGNEREQTPTTTNSTYLTLIMQLLAYFHVIITFKLFQIIVGRMWDYCEK